MQLLTHNKTEQILKSVEAKGFEEQIFLTNIAASLGNKS